MIRMVVTDLDGTLFDYNSHITDENVKAIRRIQDNGLTFAIASGRDKVLAFSALEQSGIKAEGILGNGSQYVDADGNIILSCYLGKDKLVEIIDCLDSFGIPHMIYTTDGCFTCMEPDKVRDDFIERGRQLMGRRPEEFEPGGPYYFMPCNHLRKIDDLAGFIKRDINILKVESFSIEPGKAALLRERLKDIPGIAYLSSFNDNLEVTDEHAQKGLILEEVIKLKGLSKDEVMVMGDGMNDLSLFTCFPDHSYAPANADPTIRSLATEVVSSNIDNGFAEAVNRVLDMQGAK